MLHLTAAITTGRSSPTRLVPEYCYRKACSHQHLHSPAAHCLVRLPVSAAQLVGSLLLGLRVCPHTPTTSCAVSLAAHRPRQLHVTQSPHFNQLTAVPLAYRPCQLQVAWVVRSDVAVPVSERMGGVAQASGLSGVM